MAGKIRERKRGSKRGEFDYEGELEVKRRKRGKDSIVVVAVAAAAAAAVAALAEEHSTHSDRTVLLPRKQH